MKRLLFLTFLLSFSCLGQTTRSVADLNSWIERSEDENASVEEKETAFKQIIHCFKNQSDSTLVKAYRGLAETSEELGEFTNGIAYLDTLLITFPKLDFIENRKIREDRAVLLKKAGDPDAAFSELLKILSEYEDRGFILESAKLNLRIAKLFKKMKEFENAIYHFLEGIEQGRRIDDMKIVSSGLMTLGNCYKSLEQFEKAETCYNESIEISKKHNFKRTLAGNYNNIGSLMRMTKRMTLAKSYFQKAVVINKEMNNQKWLSYNYNNIGNILKDEKKFKESLGYFKKSLVIKERIKDDQGKLLTLLNISDNYEALGDYRNAFVNRKSYIVLRDSLFELEKLEATKKIAAEFQTEKREQKIEQLRIQDELKTEKLAIRDERILYQNFLGWLMGITAVLLLAVAIILWYSSRNRKRVNEELGLKNDQIRSKNTQLDYQHNEIKSSINYAKRIQTTILPSEVAMTNFFKKYSVLYLPKDIVSGDFYLFEETSKGAFFGVIDCTGHGVPGAMMSLVGSSFFTKAIKEMKLETPEKVLDLLNFEIPKALKSNEVTIDDGMDLALCFVDRESNLLQFSGANRNCWIMNKKDKWKERPNRSCDKLLVEDDVITLELKGDRQGIGRSNAARSFTGVSVPIHSGDRVVLFTDGYVDQFGGEFNKKFKNRQLRQLIIDQFDKSAPELEIILNSTMTAWRGEEDQIDDICVMVVDF